MGNNDWLEDYYKCYPIYEHIKISLFKKAEGESLHPLYVATQKIIDQLIEAGNKRIAIVLPDDDCDVIPQLILKYFSNVQNMPEYAGSVLEEVVAGDHLRLGKAVVEFLGIDKLEKKIKFKVGRKDQMTILCPINGIHYMLEKTSGALTSHKIWCQEERAAKDILNNSDKIIQTLKSQRTTLKKTITILTAKNDFYDDIDSFYVNNVKLSDVVAYGEIDISQLDYFKLHNLGKLSGFPGISITNAIEDILYLTEELPDKLFSIYSTPEKFDEIIANIDMLKEILRYGVPFIAFIPENKFNEIPVLLELGFKLWHWETSTFRLIASNSRLNKNGNIFGVLSNKIIQAADASYNCSAIKITSLKKALVNVYKASQLLRDCSNEIKQMMRSIWALQNKLATIICPYNDDIILKLKEEVLSLQAQWKKYRNFYQGQPIDIFLKETFDLYTKFIDDKNYKALKICDFLSSIHEGKSVLLLVADNYNFFVETYEYIERSYPALNVKLMRLSSFYINIDAIKYVDYLIVSWFDRDEYIRIKQTCCYNHLNYILYDFENRWKENFDSMFDVKIPHKLVMATAKILGVDQDIVKFDRLNNIDETNTDMDTVDDEYDEISDYNIRKEVIFSTVKTTPLSSSSSIDSVECIPVLFVGDKIGFFYPTHDVIDVTALSRGVLGRALKKDACRLRKGDKILIRQSDKDLIRERADILMANDPSCDRKTVEIWRDLLIAYSQDKTIVSVRDALNIEGANCTFQQVRGWLFNETIIPRDKAVLIAIGRVVEKAANEELKKLSSSYLSAVDIIFNTGKTIQAYHQRAGRWLTSELKNKAEDIKRIIDSVTHTGNIEGIGEITIYTVDEVLDKEIVPRNKINRIEDL